MLVTLLLWNVQFKVFTRAYKQTGFKHYPIVSEKPRARSETGGQLSKYKYWNYIRQLVIISTKQFQERTSSSGLIQYDCKYTRVTSKIYLPVFERCSTNNLDPLWHQILHKILVPEPRKVVKLRGVISYWDSCAQLASPQIPSPFAAAERWGR